MNRSKAKKGKKGKFVLEKRLLEGIMSGGVLDKRKS